MAITITRPDIYTNGSPCFVTENADFPGIVGYGQTGDEARVSFENARAAYVALMQTQGSAVAPDSTASVYWMMTLTGGIGGAVAAA